MYDKLSFKMSLPNTVTAAKEYYYTVYWAKIKKSEIEKSVNLR